MRHPRIVSFSAPRAARCRPAAVSAAVTAALVAALSLGACSRPAPRSFDFFLEDPIVRDGVIARCDAHPDQSQRDIECANARRAATAEQLREEQAKRKELERESERKLEALRRHYAQRAAEREAEAKPAAVDDVPGAATGAVSASEPGQSAPQRSRPEQSAFGTPLQPPLVGVPSVGPLPEAVPGESAPSPAAGESGGAMPAQESSGAEPSTTVSTSAQPSPPAAPGGAPAAAASVPAPPLSAPAPPL